jgi:hypothetical protein
MDLRFWEYSLYFFNGLIFILSTIFFSYYLTNLDTNTSIINTLNCENIAFISFMILLNSIVNLLTIKKLKYIAMCTTFAIFSYSVSAIETIFETCEINNNIVFLYYIFNLICNSIIIFIYMVYYIWNISDYLSNKNKCFTKKSNHQLEHKLVYDVNNEELNDIYE